ncbi:fibrinogen C domain-containing protein 1-like [Uranotaenia lowii]|uniref:fibrinogen C domain-containing protein 1-like n=1 Tax=Uranotaenia lowii TaxID=190385 RepID=UPI0024796CB5|nr:fibrinogen C domain-containing protein 1-like [Uranotaenia lowii]
MNLLLISACLFGSFLLATAPVSGAAPGSCNDIGTTLSNVYEIDPSYGFGNSMLVYCDQQYDRGGWTVIQNRRDGNVKFFRGWDEYVRGFGDLRGEYWLGLEKIHQLTYSRTYQLAIVMEDASGAKAVARYSNFTVAGADNLYRLMSIGAYSGDAGDSLSEHLNFPFSTYDKDNDGYFGNCASMFVGGWWYAACHKSNLNGLYLPGPRNEFASMACWYTWKGHYYGLKSVRMMIKPA